MRILLIIFLFFTVTCMHGQLSLQHAEQKILDFGERAVKDSSGQHTVALHDSIQALFSEVLQTPESFSWPFSSLRKIGITLSPDRTFRIFNWNYYGPGGDCHYMLLIQQAARNGSCKVNAFHKTSALRINSSEFVKYDTREWYGALYYSVIPQRQNGIPYYMLLGYIPNTDLSNQKVIETMYFDEDRNPVLGMPVISILGKTYCRLLFEYNERITMALHYDETASMIVFDHLAPAAPQYLGNYTHYGPDGTYDGLAFDGGQWHVIPKINLKNKKYKRTREIIRSRPVNNLSNVNKQ